MNQEERARYREQYAEAKKRGVPFFPDAVFKDAVAAGVVFSGIFLLATVVGAGLEEIADPSDASYTPRPEWYFLFLFQLLKYFPGDLEVLGVFFIPLFAFVFLLVLPWTDRSARRHWTGRPVVTAITVVLFVGSVALTVLALTAAPPPAAAAATGDETARIYAENCAGCHGSTVAVAPGDDLFLIIEGGTHDGMPAWNSDLTPTEVDALVGFILSPNGHVLFMDNCAECHDASSLVEAGAIDLRSALETGPQFGPHADLGLPVWDDALTAGEQARLLNFLTAPDGQRLWTQECAACHGQSVAFEGGRGEVEAVIREGDRHLEMPAFEASIPPEDIETLATYVTDPPAAPDGATLFSRYCVACHATRVPTASDIDTARSLIARGGAHEDMPVWGAVLTDEQVDALVDYVLSATELPNLAEAEALYAANCASCHGDLGEGGVNPVRAGDIIAPISTAEYLATRDDATLRAIIAQGQPNFGMAPFADTFGGALTGEQVDLLVAYMRAWEDAPPVELPPEISIAPIGADDGPGVYVDLCSQCHGPSGEGGIGPAFDAAWKETKTDEQVFSDINLGHQATAMIAWGEILSSQQIADVVDHIRTLPGVATDSGPITYVTTIQPLFDAYCTMCHGTQGGWTGTSYEATMTSGIGGPTIIPGDPDNSRLVQSMVGTHPDGVVMPPSVTMNPADIQKIVDWVAAGAPER